MSPPFNGLEEIALLLRGERSSHPRGEDGDIRLLELSLEHGVEALLYWQLRKHPGLVSEDLLQALADRARGESVEEQLRCNETVRVLEALAEISCLPILLKGTALAYQNYAAPFLRPRCDTDILIPETAVAHTKRLMARLGYRFPNYADGDLIFYQFSTEKQDSWGVDHVFDFHWKISARKLFAKLFDYAEMAASSVRVPSLGRHAFTLHPVHSLALACIHPVMHHHNRLHLLWIYDIHLLLQSFTSEQAEQFLRLAREKKITAICARGIEQSYHYFKTPLAKDLRTSLYATEFEPTAQFLRPQRRMLDDLWSDFFALESWTERGSLLRQIAFPGRKYMREAFGSRVANRWDWISYSLRGVRGVWKLFRPFE